MRLSSAQFEFEWGLCVRKVVLVAAAMVAANGAEAAAGGTPLWQKSRAGMTPDEVRAIYPAAQPKEDENRYGPNYATCSLSIPRETVMERNATVDFCFTRKGLDFVRVRIGDNNRASPDRSFAVAMKGGLTAKYGQPADCKEESRGSERLECTWIKPGLKVRLMYFKGSTGSDVHVMYDALRTSQGL